MKLAEKAFITVLCLLLFAGFNGCTDQGCTDPEAVNFEPGVKYDNGSCQFCTCGDLLAENYHERFVCDARDSCLYESDEYAGTYLGSAVISYVDPISFSDTIRTYRVTITQEAWNKTVLWTNENGTDYRPDTNCYNAFSNPSDTNYNMTFTVKNATTACFGVAPVSFDFALDGDSLTYEGSIINLGSSGPWTISFKGRKIL